MLTIAGAALIGTPTVSMLLEYQDEASFYNEHTKRLSRPHVVITGASSGIGRGLAHAYARRGARLVLAARSEASLREVEQECLEANPATEVEVVPTDVTSLDSCHVLAAAAERRFGQVHMLILCAGIGYHSTFLDVEDLSPYRALMEVNYFGCVNCTHAFMPSLSRAKTQIVVLSSFSGIAGLPQRTAYCASKFAVNGFFEALRHDVAEAGVDVRVTLVCPPSVASPFRANGLSETGGSGFDDGGGDDGRMSVAECVRHTLYAADRGRRIAVFPRSAAVAARVQPLLPRVVGRLVAQRARL